MHFVCSWLIFKISNEEKLDEKNGYIYFYVMGKWLLCQQWMTHVGTEMSIK